MNTILGIIILYMTLAIVSALISRWIINAGYKGTQYEETWKKALLSFGIIYAIAGLIILLSFLIFKYLLYLIN
jgi:hypothetical protein